MTDWPSLVSALPIGGYRLSLTYSDGFTGAVDFESTVAKGGIFTFMQDLERFKAVKVSDSGSALVWVDDQGDYIDFCADSQRADIEAQRNIAAE